MYSLWKGCRFSFFRVPDLSQYLIIKWGKVERHWQKGKSVVLKKVATQSVAGVDRIFPHVRTFFLCFFTGTQSHARTKSVRSLANAFQRQQQKNSYVCYLLYLLHSLLRYLWLCPRARRQGTFQINPNGWVWRVFSGFRLVCVLPSRLPSPRLAPMQIKSSAAIC